MINHLKGFLNKCVMEFKRDDYIETWPYNSVFCVMDDEFLGDHPLHISTCLQAIIKVSESFVDNEATALIQKYSNKLFAISLYNIVLE